MGSVVDWFFGGGGGSSLCCNMICYSNCQEILEEDPWFPIKADYFPE